MESTRRSDHLTYGKVTVLLSSGRKTKLPLGYLLVIPISLQVAGAVALVGYFSLRNSERAVEAVARRFIDEVTVRVGDRLESYLAEAREVTAQNVDAVRLGQLDPTDSEALLRVLHAQMQRNPHLALASFVSVENEMFEISRFSTGDLQVDLVLAEHPRTIHSYGLDADGRQTDLLEVIPNFDPQRTPPGYRNAVAAGGPVWNPVFAFTGIPDMSVSTSAPAYGTDGELVGVFFADFTLSNIDRYLRSIKVGSGRIFITDSDGLLVASSGAGGSRTLVGGTLQRLPASESPDPLVFAAMRFLQGGRPKSLAAMQAGRHEHFQHEGVGHHLKLRPYRDALGLDWTIHVIIPDTDFFGQVQQSTRATILLSFIAASAAIGLCWYTARLLVKHIDRLSHTTQQLAAEVGDADIGWRFEQPLGRHTVRELDVLSAAIDRMAIKVQEVLGQLQHKAYYDPLVDLPNQNLFLARIRAAQARQQPDAQFAVLAVDIQRFRALRFGFGWSFGERLIVAFAKRLADYAENNDLVDVVARVGDDEFAILLVNLPDLAAAQQVADDLHAAFVKPLALPQTHLPVSICVGLAWGDSGGVSPATSLQAASTALAYTKQRQGSFTEIFSPAMQAVAAERSELEAELKAAIADNALAVHYQPIVSLATGRVVSFEALARWQHPIRGTISPGSFIPLAEETGSIVELGSWMLRQACQQFARWQQEIPDWEVASLSVNFSWLQLRHPNLIAELDAALEPLPPGTLRLEITESSLLTETSAARELLERLRRRQVRLSIDDFGTGYSSLSYLQDLPIDTLKLDRSFVSRLEADARTCNIVSTIVALARTLGLEIVAEGIETQGQLRILRDLGCDFGQGYLFARPLPAAVVPAFLSEYSLLQNESILSIEGRLYGSRG